MSMILACTDPNTEQNLIHLADTKEAQSLTQYFSSISQYFFEVALVVIPTYFILLELFLERLLGG